MMSATRVLASVAVAAACTPASASIRHYGRQMVKSPLWSEDLEDLVNSPLRIEGVSSFGATEFHYEGNSRQINNLLETYSKSDSPHVYLTVGELGSHAASLQVQHHGDGRSYLTIHVQSEAMLEALVIPRGVHVEALPPVCVRIDPIKRAEESALWKQVESTTRRR
jgi:hypothetical protein